MLQSNITLCYICSSFFFNDTATTEIYTLSLHDALPIFFDSSEISESVNFCVMEAIKLCRLDTPIIFIEARINLIGVSNLQSFIASMTQKNSAGWIRQSFLSKRA